MNIKNVFSRRNFIGICILLATSFTSLAEELDSQSKPSRLDSNRMTFNSPVATFTLKNSKDFRILHDSDGDGCCDHWCSLFPRNPKIVGRDSDGDGMTDYEEMVLMQDPDVINPLPRKLTARELIEQDRDRKIKRKLTDPSNDSDDTNNLKIEIPITHDGTSPTMRIMLCWTDPPYQDSTDEAVTVGAVDPEVLPATADDDTPRPDRANFDHTQPDPSWREPTVHHSFSEWIYRATIPDPRIKHP